MFVYERIVNMYDHDFLIEHLPINLKNAYNKGLHIPGYTISKVKVYADIYDYDLVLNETNEPIYYDHEEVLTIHYNAEDQHYYIYVDANYFKLNQHLRLNQTQFDILFPDYKHQ